MKETVGKVWHEMIAAMREKMDWNVADWPEHSLLCECNKCTPSHFRFTARALTKTRRKK